MTGMHVQLKKVCAQTLQMPMSRMDMAAWPGRTHAYAQVPVLYPFGYGLSYTTFETRTIRHVVDDDTGADGFSVTVANTGEYAY